MSEKPNQETTPKEEKKPKEEGCKKECPGFRGFHGFGPRCHARHFGFPMFGPPSAHLHKHKERKCECGEVIPKRKEGEPKVKVCPKCGKDLPKKKHGFGMRCHKMKKMMKFMNMFGGQQLGPHFGLRNPPCPNRGLEVNHYIHFGSPERRRRHHGPHGRGFHSRHGFGRPPMGPGFGRPPMGPGFGRPPMGPGFGRPPMGPGFGRPPMGPGFGRPPMGPGFGRPPMGPPGLDEKREHRHRHHHRHLGRHGPHKRDEPCEKPPCEEVKKEDKNEEKKEEAK